MSPSASRTPARPTPALRADADTASRLRIVVARLSRRLRPTEAGSALTPTQISILFTVARERTLALSTLARIEAVNPTLLSRAVAALADAGLLRRELDPDDRRAVLVHITPAGRELRGEIQRERAQLLRSELGGLEREELRALLEALPVLETLAERLRERRS